MGLVVGENSYMTLEEADNIVVNNFIKSDAERQYWTSLDNEDKTTLILKVTKEVNNTCLFKGHFVTREQALAFPRCIERQVVECPEDIKTAIIMQILRPYEIKSNKILSMLAEGVVSIADGTGANVHLNNTISKDMKKKVAKIGSVYQDIYENYLNQWCVVCI